MFIVVDNLRPCAVVTLTKSWIELIDNSQTHTRTVYHLYSTCSMHFVNSINQIASVVVLFTSAKNKGSSKSRPRLTFHEFMAYPRPCNNVSYSDVSSR